MAHAPCARLQPRSRTSLRAGAGPQLLTRISLSLALLFPVSLAMAQKAHACSCMMPPEPSIALGQSAAVFRGSVLTVRSVPAPSGPGPGPGAGSTLLEVQFQVQDLWKGDKREQITLRTPSDSAACGRSFVVGQTYLVYARSDARGLTDNLCTRTQSQEPAIARDIKVLGPPLWHKGAAARAPGSPGSAPKPAKGNAEPPAVSPGRRCSVQRPHSLPWTLAGALGLLLVFRPRAR